MSTYVINQLLCSPQETMETYYLQATKQLQNCIDYYTVNYTLCNLEIQKKLQRSILSSFSNFKFKRIQEHLGGKIIIIKKRTNLIVSGEELFKYKAMIQSSKPVFFPFFSFFQVQTFFHCSQKRNKFNNKKATYSNIQLKKFSAVKVFVQDLLYAPLFPLNSIKSLQNQL